MIWYHMKFNAKPQCAHYYDPHLGIRRTHSEKKTHIFGYIKLILGTALNRCYMINNTVLI